MGTPFDGVSPRVADRYNALIQAAREQGAEVATLMRSRDYPALLRAAAKHPRYATAEGMAELEGLEPQFGSQPVAERGEVLFPRTYERMDQNVDRRVWKNLENQTLIPAPVERQEKKIEQKPRQMLPPPMPETLPDDAQPKRADPDEKFRQAYGKNQLSNSEFRDIARKSGPDADRLYGELRQMDRALFEEMINKGRYKQEPGEAVPWSDEGGRWDQYSFDPENHDDIMGDGWSARYYDRLQSLKGLLPDEWQLPMVDGIPDNSNVPMM